MADLSDLFKLVAEEKKKQKEEIDSLIGDSFDKLFVEQLKTHKTPEQLAKKHKVPVSQIKNQLKKGTKVEKEHTKDVELATTIASQHIDELPDYYDRLSKVEKKPIKEGLLNILPQEKTPDPLTPLNQNFATLDDLQKHYKLFLSRIQQQLSTLGGGGETRLEFLDDIDRNSAKTDNYFLKYDATLNKWIGDPADGVGITSIVSITGVTTYYQANDADDYIGVSANVPVTIVLPQIPSYGKKLVVKDEGNQINTYNITVQAGIGKSVENDISVTMSSNHQSFSFFYNGSNWYIV
jgi:hypothetical protein